MKNVTEDTEVLPVNPAMYTATIEETEAAVYKTTKLSLKIEQINKYDAKGVDFNTVECTLKSEVNPRIAIKCNVYKVEDDEYCIQFTPTFRGRHQLIVVINGEEVTGSPFPVFVSIIQRTIELEKPIKMMNANSIHGECDAEDMAFNSLGEMIIMSSEKIEVRDKGFKILRSFVHSDYGVFCNGFIKVTVDSTNNIYILSSTHGSHCTWSPMILKLNKNLELVNTTGLASADGISVVDDRVLAYSNRSIDIYTTDLEHVGQITSPERGSPGYFHEVMDISSDKTGNLYILAPFQETPNKGRVEVVVFSSSGKYLHSLDVDSLSVPTPYNNCSICVAGKYVYIAASYSSRGYDHGVIGKNVKVYVYTTDEPHNISKELIIEHRSPTRDSQFHDPIVEKLHVDENGFIYVLFDSKILIF